MYTPVPSNGISQCFRHHQGAWRCALPSAAHAARTSAFILCASHGIISYSPAALSWSRNFAFLLMPEVFETEQWSHIQDWMAGCSSVPGHRLFHVFLEDGRYHALPATGALAGMQVKPLEAWSQKAWEPVMCSCLNGVRVVFFCGCGRFQLNFLERDTYIYIYIYIYTHTHIYIY